MSRWLLRAAVSVVAAIILFTFVPLHGVVDAFRRVSLGTWLASLIIFFAGHYANAFKLRLLVAPTSVPLSAFVRAQYAGLVANLGLPGLAGGDLVRAAYLAPSAGTRKIALASVADRVIDTATLVAIAAVALILAGVPPALADLVQHAVWWLGAAVACAAAAVLALAVLVRRRSFGGKLAQAWTELRARRSALSNAAVISLTVQSAFVLTNVWLARAVGVDTGLAAWFVAWPLSKLIAVLPISLGGIGVREAALVSLLVPYGAPSDAVLATGLLWQTVLAVSGLAGLLVTHFMRKAPTQRESINSTSHT